MNPHGLGQILAAKSLFSESFRDDTSYNPLQSYAREELRYLRKRSSQSKQK